MFSCVHLLRTPLFIFSALALAGACGNDPAPKQGDGGAPTDDGGALDPDAGDPRPARATCLERGQNLPARQGEELRVSPAGPGQVNINDSTSTLRQVVSGAQSGDTIVLEDGTYTFEEAGAGSYTGLYFTTSNITMRSASGDASKVILDSAYSDHGDETGVISIDASGIVLADFSVKRSIFHLVHLWKDADDAILHNLRLIDGGQQFLKSSPGSGTVDNLELSCSEFIMSSAGRDNVWGYGSQDGGTRCYTGGVDSHNGRNWEVHDNRFEGIYCDASGVARPAHGKKAANRNGMTYQGGLSEHAIHMWDSEQGSSHTIVRNQIINCARGIGLGLQDDVYGGLIANNMVFSEHAASGEHDVAISIMRGHSTVVANNSIYYASAQSYSDAIEYRWDSSTGLRILNNLSNRQLKARDGATASLSTNVVDAAGSWFVDGLGGDLHLSDCNLAAVAGTGQALAEVADDFDLESREGTIDIGADQCQ